MNSLSSSGPSYVGETFDGQFMLQSELTYTETKQPPTAQSVVEDLWKHYDSMEKIQASQYETTKQEPAGQKV
jgi:hypothetical protein